MHVEAEALVRLAAEGDVKAYVELIRRFQHLAFGSALALVHDFHQAEDVVQEAFLAAWSALPSLAEPAAFPGWLRGIVRHQAIRLVRKKHLAALPLTEADEVPTEEPSQDDRLALRQQAWAALATIAELPSALREPATLFYVHECSHQDIAAFLGLSVATVNNRLHAARTQLKEGMLTMVTQTLQSHALPDDFASRIGRLVETRGSVIEALFDPASLPDILTELVISDEPNRRAVSVQVIQRPGGGIVRAITTSPIDSLPRGSTVLSSGRHTDQAVTSAVFERLVPLLAGQPPVARKQGQPLETGIKVIDVMCPLIGGGSVAIAGDLGAGITVVMEEIVRRLSSGPAPVSMFVVMPPPSADRPRSLNDGFSHAEELKKEGYSEGTVGAVQTFFVRGEDGPWAAERLAALAAVDVVIRLSRDLGRAKIYPTVDVLASRSRALDALTVGHDHAELAERIRHAITMLRATDAQPQSDADRVALERARKVQNFFGQPFFVAEPYTKRPGSYVSRADALRGCREILDGSHDDLPPEVFHFNGSIGDIRSKLGT